VRGTWVIPAVVTACGFSPATGDGGHAIDTAPVFKDTQPDTPADDNCFGTLTYDTVCYKKSDPLPTGARNVNMMFPLDSDDDANCDQSAMGVPGTCVVSADSITITATGKLRVTGMRPVILLATGTTGINLDAMALLDIGSNTMDQGAGGLASCPGTTAATEHGGGFGGSFVVTGGKGGKDQAGNGPGAPAPVLGVPTTLHGGCPGGVGAAAEAVVATVAAGKSGGAVVLIASVIIVDGLIAAYGGGGHGNPMFAGGGGGGAGGMVVLDSALIKGNGEVNVKGGGGGGGAGGNASGDGHDGYDPAMRPAEGSGGTDNSQGGDGGHGGPHDAMDPTGEDGMTGSGGGGGGGPGGGGGGGAQGVVVTTSTPMGTITGAN
jgi:hypothetical protein